MKQLLIFIAATLLLATPAKADQPSPNAVAMAHIIGPNILVRISADIIPKTPAYRGLVNSVGQSKANDDIKAAIIQQLPGFLPAWDNVTATSFTGLLSDDEMGEIARKNPSLSTEQNYHNAVQTVAPRLKQMGDPVIRAFVGAVLASAMTQTH